MCHRRNAPSIVGIGIGCVRAPAQALVAMGTHVVPVEIVSVDPRTEPSTNRFARNVSQGRYLQSSDAGAVVVGQAIADRLIAGLDDEILATAVRKYGDIESTQLRIVGIVRTGSDEIDATICHVMLGDVEQLTGVSGAGEVTLILDDWERADLAKAPVPRTLEGGIMGVQASKRRIGTVAALAMALVTFAIIMATMPPAIRVR